VKLDKEDFWLHEFRSTFATRCVWAGVDLRTVQQWLGHSDIESTIAVFEAVAEFKGTGEGE
jgi:site-specific recombinase XerD